MTCTLADCERPLEKWHTQYCSLHRMRLRQRGDVHWQPVKSAGSINASGYRVLSGFRGHPIAFANGQMLEHRLVLFNQIGIGPHLCAHCATAVRWGVDLQTDHLDHNRLNNDPANLVPSCAPCNKSSKRRAKKV